MLNFLISPAHASGTAAAGGVDFMAFLPMVVIFALFWFLMVRPQQKRLKEHKAMVEALQKGDEVVVGGGVVGKITKLNDQYLTIETGQNTALTVQRQAVQALLPKGTLKDL